MLSFTHGSTPIFLLILNSHQGVHIRYRHIQQSSGCTTSAFDQSHKKGIYIDGHKQDVVKYRKLYLRKLDILSSTHLPPPLCEDGLSAVQRENPAASKHLVLIFHDESNFHTNEGDFTIWAEEGRVSIHPKNQGRGVDGQRLCHRASWSTAVKHQ